MDARETFRKVVEELGFAKCKPSDMSNSDYWLCSVTAMEQYATEKAKHVKECNKDLVRKLGTAQMRIEELEEEVKRLKAFDNGDSFPM